MAKSGSTTTTAACVGYYVDARDKKRLWAEAKIVQCNLRTHKVKVHFVGWSKNLDVWADPKSIAPHGSHAPATMKGKDAQSWDGDMALFDDVLDAEKPTDKAASKPTKCKSKAPAKKQKSDKSSRTEVKKMKEDEPEQSDADEPLVEPASEEDDVPAVISKRRKTNDGNAGRISSIRVRSPNVSPALSNWGDLNTTLAKAKEIDRESSRRMHTVTLKWEKERFRATMSLEEKRLQLEEKRATLEEKQTELENRRLASSEDEARYRVRLLEAQAKKEVIQTQREEILLKLDVARSRKRLRDEGVPELEINVLFPLHPN